jgi:hypothetical protein
MSKKSLIGLRIDVLYIKNRKELTNEWDIRGAVKNDYEIFTALMSKETFDINAFSA